MGESALVDSCDGKQLFQQSSSVAAAVPVSFGQWAEQLSKAQCIDIELRAGVP
jgi:hypothetical protein